MKPDFDPVVRFDPIDRWFVGEDGPCVYTYNFSLRDSTSWDWIGLYKASIHQLLQRPTETKTHHFFILQANFTSINDYQTFIWSAPGNGTEQRKSTFPDIRVAPGQYRLLYISNEARDILGMSEPFEVV